MLQMKLHYLVSHFVRGLKNHRPDRRVPPPDVAFNSVLRRDSESIEGRYPRWITTEALIEIRKNERFWDFLTGPSNHRIRTHDLKRAGQRFTQLLVF